MTTLAELERLERDYAIPTYVRSPVQFVRGSGVRLWDEHGGEYLDFLAGISVLNVGHCHPRVVEAIRDQAGRLTHATNLFYTEPALRLSERLSSLSLGGKVFLTNSGTEAVEAALKLARRARPGGEIVVLEGAFHGRTYGALSGHAAGVQAGAVRAARPGVRGGAKGRERARGRRRRADRRRTTGADPGRERDPRRRRRAARGRARGV